MLADPYKYILNGDGREELYDLRTDPAESRDLTEAPEAARILPLLRRRATEIRDSSSALR